MTGRLAGKRAVVTAAGQGIGRAIAEAFIEEGAQVHASDLDAKKLEGLAAASARALDVRDGDAIARYAGETGPVDVLVNCVGYVAHGTVLDCDDASWDLSFDVNVRSAHRMIRAFLPGMLERAAGGSGASIVNISSAASSVKGVANRYVYGASKAALIGMTKSIAVDFIQKGVRCNAICPGTVQSPSLDARIAALAASTGAPVEKVRADFIGRQPMGRLGAPREIAMLALYLASDESAFTTGLAHVIDGGWSA